MSTFSNFVPNRVAQIPVTHTISLIILHYSDLIWLRCSYYSIFFIFLPCAFEICVAPLRAANFAKPLFEAIDGSGIVRIIEKYLRIQLTANDGAGSQF